MDVITLPVPLDLETGKPVSRVESGVVQFVGDWPGVFIRGDHAFQFAMELEAAIEKLYPSPPQLQDIATYINYSVLRGLLSLLQECEVKPDTMPGK